jgi:hypothetical protein
MCTNQTLNEVWRARRSETTEKFTQKTVVDIRHRSEAITADPIYSG